jgi:hypothetical protein
MPMPKGKSKETRSKIVKQQVDEGKPQKQAVAIAYSVWRKRNGKKG